MSARSFRSVFMVATCAGAALTCYLVSLNVASERASLEDVENKIVLAQRDIRVLQTEIGTRGRLAQLERWNVKVLALSAPAADQFLEGGFQLARLARPEEKLDVQAPVVMASAPAPQPESSPLEEGERRVDDGAGANVPAARLLHEASLKIQPRDVEPQTREAMAQPLAERQPPKHAEIKAQPAKLATKLPAAKPATAKAAAAKAPAMPAKKADPKAAAAKDKKAGDNKAQAAAKLVTKPVRMAKVDPLAPLPAKANSKKTARESGTAR